MLSAASYEKAGWFDCSRRRSFRRSGCSARSIGTRTNSVRVPTQGAYDVRHMPRVWRMGTDTTSEDISFGPFQLFPRRRLLLEEGRQVRLGGRALDMLLLLIDR